MDEKILNFEEQYNCQNDDLWSNILWDEGEGSKCA